MNAVDIRTKSLSRLFRPQAWVLALGVALVSGNALAGMEDDTAKAILKNNDCTKCHSVTKTKKGPSYEKIAAKHKGDAQAMEKLYKQLTTAPMVKLEDGSEEEHKILEADEQEIRALLEWILER